MPQISIVPTGKQFAAESTSRCCPPHCAPDSTCRTAARAATVPRAAHACWRVVRISRRGAAGGHNAGRGCGRVRAAVPGTSTDRSGRRNTRGAAGRRSRGQEPAMPHRPHGAPGRRCHGRVLRLPVVEELHYLAGQYLDVILRKAAAVALIASAPADGKLLELHVRKASSSGFTGSCSIACVPERCAHRGAARPILVSRRIAACAALHRRRHRVCAVAGNVAAVAGAR